MKSKESRIPASLLAAASELISGRMGLCFQEGRGDDLEKALRSAAGDFGYKDPSACVRWLISSGLTESQVKVLAGRLTVGETYFFRDKICFDFLEQRVFPELIGSRYAGRRSLRILSAGCCTGEEPYSIAMLLHRMMSHRKEWDITIFGTDINPLFLAKAAAAVYGEWSFRDTRGWVKERYFTKTKENRFTLLAEVREGVSFVYHNLAADAPPTLSHDKGGMDLILCRNVLMYLTPDHQRRVVRRLRQQLAEGGWLIVGPSEVSDALFSDFVSVNFQGVTFYRNSRKVSGPGREPAPGVFRSHVVLAPPPEYQVMEVAEADPAAGPPASPKPMPAETAPDLYGEALALYAEGSFTEAAEKLKPLLSGSLQEAGAAALLARIFADRGRLTEAFDLCERAVGADRCNASYRYLLATVLQELGRLEDAAAELRKTLYLDQDFVLAHILLGNFALNSGERKESARHFRNALTLLRRRQSEELVPGAEGLTAGRLMEIIMSTGFEDVA